MTIQEKATLALKYLTTRSRDNGSRFICQTDDAPDWMNTLCQEAHSGDLPDDYKYEFIKDALEIIAEYDEDAYHTKVDESVDISTYKLVQWLGSTANRCVYVDNAVEEFGHSKDGIAGDLALGQFNEREEVLQLVLSQLESVELDDDGIEL